MIGRRGLGHRAGRRATGNHAAPEDAARPAQARPRKPPRHRPAPQETRRPTGHPAATSAVRPERPTGPRRATRHPKTVRGRPPSRYSVSLGVEERLTRLRAVGAAVLLAGRVALVVDQAGAAEGLGHRAVRRGRLGVAGIALRPGLGSPAPAVTGVAWSAAPAVAAGPEPLPLRSPPAPGRAAAACALTALAASAIAASAPWTGAARAGTAVAARPVAAWPATGRFAGVPRSNPRSCGRLPA